MALLIAGCPACAVCVHQNFLYFRNPHTSSQHWLGTILLGSPLWFPPPGSSLCWCSSHCVFCGLFKALSLSLRGELQGLPPPGPHSGSQGICHLQEWKNWAKQENSKKANAGSHWLPLGHCWRGLRLFKSTQANLVLRYKRSFQALPPTLPPVPHPNNPVPGVEDPSLSAQLHVPPLVEAGVLLQVLNHRYLHGSGIRRGFSSFQNKHGKKRSQK